MTSTVKWWDANKGFGFIVNPDKSGRDFFVHYANIIRTGNGKVNLTAGQRVDFATHESEKGTQAINVTPI